MYLLTYNAFKYGWKGPLAPGLLGETSIILIKECMRVYVMSCEMDDLLCRSTCLAYANAKKPFGFWYAHFPTAL